MNNFNNVNCKTFCLLLLVLFFSTTTLASVCFTLISVKIYAYSYVADDFNNDGITDKYEIAPTGSEFDTYSLISLSENSQEFSNSYKIDESWTLNPVPALTGGELIDFAPIPLSSDGIPTKVLSFDADNDGFKDIIAAFGSRIVIRINDKSGGFNTNTQQVLSMPDLYGIDESLISEKQSQAGVTLFILDINSDGYEDLVVFHKNFISIFMNDMTGNFYHLKNYTIADNIDESIFINLYDMDGDSLPEIIVNVLSSGTTYAVYFSEAVNIDVVIFTSLYDVLKPMDVDNDGDLDLVEKNLTPIYCSSGYVADSEYKSYWLNSGNGTFERVIKNKSSTIIDNLTPVADKVAPVVNDGASGTGSTSIQYLLVLLILLFSRNKNSAP